MTKETPFQIVIDALLDEKPFPPRYLRIFSDLDPANLKLLLQTWPSVPAARKLTLLEDLELLAETDTITNFEDLARALLTDQDAGVRIIAIRLLWECTDTKLVPVYLNILNNDESEAVRAAAATALGLFIYEGELEEIPANILHKVEESLLDAAQNAKATLVQRRAVESLGASSRDEVPPLIEAAYHRKDPDWVVSALFAMGRSCDKHWEKHVLSRLHSQDDDIRSEAVHSAGELEIGSAREALFDLLADEEDVEIRRIIIWALSKIGGEGVRPRLEELLEIEPDEEEADFIDEALENLSFTEDLAKFDMLDVDPAEDLIEADFFDGDEEDDEE
jgi:HEAT repeat protein